MISKLDRELILRLQQAGRLSYVALARALQVSERTVRNRIKKLLDRNIIRITAVPNLDTLGYSFMGIVGLQVRLSDLRIIAQQLANHPNVCFLANVTGTYDFIAVVVGKSAREFSDFMESFISPIPGILRTETFVSLNIYKGQTGTLDIAQLINTLPVSSAKAAK